jgi:hypothetical protein
MAVMSHEELRPKGRPIRAIATAAVLTAACVLATACGSTPGRAHHPGTVVASLPIPFSPPVPGQPDVITVTAAAGERFSFHVATSDGPFYWAQAAGPDPALIRPAGEFNDGHCAKDLVGCRVPFFAAYTARHPGTTTMKWAYHALDCPASAPPAAGGKSCARVVTVTFDITISPAP